MEFYFNLIKKYNMATITAADVNKLRTARCWNDGL
jgi:hypothetical protein